MAFAQLTTSAIDVACGTFNSKTIIVMIIAITPSLNAAETNHSLDFSRMSATRLRTLGKSAKKLS